MYNKTISYNNNQHSSSSLLLEKFKLNTNNKVEKFLGSDNRDLNSKLNIIESQHIVYINEISQFNSIFSELYGEMYYNFVLIRKYIYTNKEFLKNTLNALAKIVHPSIQIFYGLMFSKEGDETDYFNIILEYFNGINLSDIEFLKPYLNSKEETYLKLLITDKIAQTMAFLYKSECPHLMLNGKNIKINHNLVKDKHQNNKIIYCDNSYIGSNLIKINEIGSYFRYNKAYKIFHIESEDIYEISYHSPEFLQYFEDKEQYIMETKLDKLEKYDVWSFGCIVFELFTGKRPYSDIYGKKSLIKTICSINKNSPFAKYNEAYLNEIQENKDNTIGELIVELILLCTGSTTKERPNFNSIVALLSNAIKQFQKENFKQDEIEEIRKKVNDEGLGYFDFKRFEDMVSLNKSIKNSNELTTNLKLIESEIEKIETAYQDRKKEIERYKLMKEFNKDNIIHTRQQSMNVNYFINYLMFTQENDENLYIYNIYRDVTTPIDLSNAEDYFMIYKNANIYFSLNKKKLFISGGYYPNIEKKRANFFGSFYVEKSPQDDDNMFNFVQIAENTNGNQNLTIRPPIKHGSSKVINSKRCMSPQKSIVSPTTSLKNRILKLSFKEKLDGFKQKEEDDDDDNDNSTQISSICFFRPQGKSLIKRANHSVIELENYLFYVGGDQGKKCEILDENNNFIFIEELNTIHIKPILFIRENKIYSLNFENLKKNFNNYIKEKKEKGFSSTYDSEKTRERNGSLYRRHSFGGETNFLDKKFIFCESYNIAELTSNPKWQIEHVHFNLPSNFSFEEFAYYSYIIMKEELIYIIGSNKPYKGQNDFKLYGICFNIVNMEYTELEKRTLLKLDPLKNSLTMSSNIIDHNSNFYYFNGDNKRVEKLAFTSILS